MHEVHRNKGDSVEIAFWGTMPTLKCEAYQNRSAQDASTAYGIVNELKARIVSDQAHTLHAKIGKPRSTGAIVGMCKAVVMRLCKITASLST